MSNPFYQNVSAKHLERLYHERDYYLKSEKSEDSEQGKDGYRLMAEFYDSLIKAAEDHLRGKISNPYTTPNFIRLYNAIADLINFCWDENGWIGTETIRKSGQFLKRMGELRDAIVPFIPTRDFFRSNED